MLLIGFCCERNLPCLPLNPRKINLTDNERQILQAVVQKGKSAARSQTRARILLKAAEGSRDKDIIDALNVSPSMVAKTRQRCVEEGPEAALKDHPRPGKAPKLSDKQAAHLIAVACSDAPSSGIKLRRFLQLRNYSPAFKKTRLTGR